MPPAAAKALVIRVTCAGTGLFVEVPLPSCPPMLFPQADRSVGLDGKGIGRACGYADDVAQTRNPRGKDAFRQIADPQFTELIGAPRPDGAVGAQGQGMA